MLTVSVRYPHGTNDDRMYSWENEMENFAFLG